jgi:hypothetical protein
LEVSILFFDVFKALGEAYVMESSKEKDALARPGVAD